MTNARTTVASATTPAPDVPELRDEFPGWDVVPPVDGRWFAFRASPLTEEQRVCEARSTVTARTLLGLRDELLTEIERDEQANHVYLV